MTATELEKLTKQWRLVYDKLRNDKDNSYWIENESDFESICVGWCLAKGLTLDAALAFYQAMIPLELF